MDWVKDNRLLTGLLRKKTWCVQLWLNSYQADLQRGEVLTKLCLDLLVTVSILGSYTQGTRSIPCAKTFTLPRTLQPSRKPAAFLSGLDTWRDYPQSVVTEQTNTSVLPPLTGIWCLLKSYGQCFPGTSCALVLPDLPVCSSTPHHSSVTVRKGRSSLASQ